MSAPKRIQMSLQRPWRAEHPDAVIVARPGKWGNPYRDQPCHADVLLELANPKEQP